MRIAIIGTGISGLAVAWLLNRKHEVRVFEAENRVGGHTHTVVVERAGREVALDTGFIVFNKRNYPNLTRLFDILDIASKPTDMSFGVSCEGCRVEYSGLNLFTLFAQKRNLLRANHYRMLLDIVRFGRRAGRQLKAGGVRGQTLGEYLHRSDYGGDFARHYLQPLAAALWSTGSGTVDSFPMEMLLRFFDNHGLLRVQKGFEWRTVRGGSHQYVLAMLRDLGKRIHTGTPVTALTRKHDGVRLRFQDGESELFDRAVLATHADQALALLSDRSRAEYELLSPWHYSQNETWLHTDVSLLPMRRSAWASWNYTTGDCSRTARRVSVSYYLNRLQRLHGADDFFVTLNPERDPREDTVIKRMIYRHPVYTPESVATQSHLHSLNGPLRTFFCGAYFGYGFHEDALRSALHVADAFGQALW